MDSRILRGAPRVLGTAALFTALLIAPTTAANTLPGGVTGEACAGDEGVTVVVDFTDTGGEIVVGCATGPQESGRTALEGAGFAPEDTFPGMIGVIDGVPNPVPEEFDGNFWSYWFVNDGEWESSMVGADEAKPAPGDIEGWRYFDGSEAPQIDPAADLQTADDAAVDADNAPTDDATDAGAGDTPTEDASAPAGNAGVLGGAGVWIGVVVAIAVVGGLIALVVRRNRQTD